MKRREFIQGLGGAAAWPLAVLAQKRTRPVIGELDAGGNISNEFLEGLWADFLDGLKEAGYTEGKNVAIEMRKANWQSPRLPTLAKDLVDRQVAVIIAVGGESALQAAKSATSTIPIVSANGFDLVKYGYAASLNRPGGNITGVTALSDHTLMGKQVGLLHELLPRTTSFGYLTGRLGDPISMTGRTPCYRRRVRWDWRFLLSSTGGSVP
jgi:putative tryptophan/tyrosine transport system substrate-binding protein